MLLNQRKKVVSIIDHFFHCIKYNNLITRQKNNVLKGDIQSEHNMALFYLSTVILLFIIFKSTSDYINAYNYIYYLIVHISLCTLILIYSFFQIRFYIFKNKKLILLTLFLNISVLASHIFTLLCSISNIDATFFEILRMLLLDLCLMSVMLWGISYMSIGMIPIKYQNINNYRYLRPISKFLFLLFVFLVFLLFKVVDKEYLTAITFLNAMIVFITNPQNILIAFSNIHNISNDSIKENVRKVFLFVNIILYIANFSLIVSTIYANNDIHKKTLSFSIIFFLLVIIVFILSILGRTKLKHFFRNWIK